MSFYSPSNLFPENITFDKSNIQLFTWKINGSPQFSYRLYIYKNSDNTLIYDSTTITSSVGQHSLPANVLANGIVYKWYIHLTDSLSNTIDSEYILFNCESAPSVSLGTNPSTQQNYLFTATFTTGTTTQIQKFQFILYDSTGINIIQDSGDIFDFNVQYQINGLISGQQYSIKCIVTDQNNLSGFDLHTFTVTYSSLNPVPLFIVTALDNIGAIQIDFSQIILISGTVTGSSSYVTGKFGQGLSLTTGSYLSFTQSIPLNYTLTFYTKLANTFTGDVVTLVGANNFRVFYNGTRWGFQLGSFITVGRLRSIPNTGEFIKVALKHDHVIISTSTYTEIIF